MTDDKTKNEGAPSAEPDAIRDGAGHGPADPGRITIDVEALENMTPGQLAEYAREHPEELPQMIDGLKKSFEALGNNSKSNVTDALRAGLIQTDEGEETADYLQGTKAKREIEKTLKAASLKPLREIENDDYMKIIQKRLKDVFSSISRVSAILAESAPGIEKLDALFTEIDELKPFIADIMKKDPGTQGKTIDDLLEDLPPTAAIYIFKGLESPADQKGEDLPAELPEEEHATIRKIICIIRQAREAKKAEEERGQLPAVTYTNRPGIELTTDRLMTVFFGANAPKAAKGQIPGQLSFLPVKYEKTGAPEITLYYTYDFDNDVFNRLKLEKKIDDEDYFILSFIASYWRMGEKAVSVYRLYKDMNGENPNTRQLTNLTNRLMKIAATNIFINDKEVRRAWAIVDEKKTYKEILTPLAPIKVGAERFKARGQVVEAGIVIYDEPDIMRLGYEMGQYTTIPKNLLHVKKRDGRKISRTPRFYRVLHYLIRRIAAMKSGNLSHKILYDTLYKETGEKSPRDKQLARDCMYAILDYFKECDKWITGYKEETTASTGKVGVTIFCTTAAPEIARKKK